MAREGQGPRSEPAEANCKADPLVLFFIYLFTYLFTLPPTPLSTPAHSRRSPSPRPASLTGTFCPGAQPAWPSTGPARVFFNLHASSLELPTGLSRALPTTPPVYQMELLDASLIPHRLSSSPDWRPLASLFVPALGRGHRHSPINQFWAPCMPLPSTRRS